MTSGRCCSSASAAPGAEMSDATHCAVVPGGDSGMSAGVSTPSTHLEALPVDVESGDRWQGWDAQDRQAVEDAERFDDITVGFMDEDAMPVEKPSLPTGRGLSQASRPKATSPASTVRAPRVRA